MFLKRLRLHETFQTKNDFIKMFTKQMELFPWDFSQIPLWYLIWMLLIENLQLDQLELHFTKSFQLHSLKIRSHLHKRLLIKNETIKKRYRCLDIWYYYFYPLLSPGWYEEDVWSSPSTAGQSYISTWNFPQVTWRYECSFSIQLTFQLEDSVPGPAWRYRHVQNCRFLQTGFYLNIHKDHLM